MSRHGREIFDVLTGQDFVSEGVGSFNTTPFQELLTTSFSPLIELDASNGLSLERRDTVTTTGSGSATAANGEIVVSTGTTSGSTALLKTKERGRYQPGIAILPGIAVRIPTTPTGDGEITWGYYDEEDGFQFGVDSTGVFVRHIHNGVNEDKVYQGDWNANDQLDGNGPTGLTLDLTRMTIYRQPGIYYGGGPWEMVIKPNDQSNFKSRLITIHRFGVPDGEPIVGNPKLPLTAEASNGTTTTDLTVAVGGRHVSVQGRYEPNRREVPETVVGVSCASGTTTPLLSFRKKSDRTSTTKSVKINGGSMRVTEAGFLKIYLNPTLTGASFGSLAEVPDDETACEVDTSATAMSGGVLLESVAINAESGNPNQTNISTEGIQALGQDLPDGTPVTLAFDNISTSSATVDASFEVEEEW